MSSEFVTVAGEITVPIVGGGSIPWASVREQINVRRGPGTSFKSLGTLNPRDSVILTGRDATGAWMQIGFSPGPDAKGWVAASFLDGATTDGLPVVSESGTVVGTSTPTTVPSVIGTAPAEARDDGNSAGSPAASVEFSPSGAGSMIYSSDLSSPQGDALDWILFVPYRDKVILRLACSGDADIKAELSPSALSVAGGTLAACNHESRLTVDPGTAYTLQLGIAPATARSAYVRYTVSIHDLASP